jgi:hypothetical protein
MSRSDSYHQVQKFVYVVGKGNILIYVSVSSDWKRNVSFFI